MGTPFLGVGVFGWSDDWGPCSSTFIGIKPTKDETGSGGSSIAGTLGGGSGISACPGIPAGVIGVAVAAAPPVGKGKGGGNLATPPCKAVADAG